MNDCLNDYWRIWGDPAKRDPLLDRIGEWEMKKMIVRHEAVLEEIGNAKAIFRLNNGKWTMLTGGWSAGWPTEEMANEQPDAPYYRTYGVWKAEEWARFFAPVEDEGMKHHLRTYIYASTIQAVWKGEYQTEQGNLVKIPADEKLVSGSRFYSAPMNFPEPAVRQDTRISVVEEDCLLAAEKLVRSGEQHVAVLNMANRQCPGGGVYTGSGAQEESCFRRSNYFLSLYQYIDFSWQFSIPRSEAGSYPMDRNYGGCFSPNVTVFRGLDRDGCPFLEDPWKVSFIAVAALNRPGLVPGPDGVDRLAPEMIPGALNKIRTVFNIAIDQGMDTLVLGAMGCGAFRNPPEHMAELFAQVLQEPPYRGRFRKIVFAIIKSRRNLEAFRAFFPEEPEL